MEFVPQFFGLQAARDLGHLLARDAGIGGDEGLRARTGRAPAEVPVPVQRGQVGQRLLVAGGLLHELFFKNKRKNGGKTHINKGVQVFRFFKKNTCK